MTFLFTFARSQKHVLANQIYAKSKQKINRPINSHDFDCHDITRKSSIKLANYKH